MTAIYKNIEQTTHVASKRQQMELNFPHKNTDDVGRPTPHKKKRLREKFSRPYILNVLNGPARNTKPVKLQNQ